ncbi:zinc-binding dehydrogenase [Nocardioides convexus]|uniref:zinc-binding dehydrogenase n=1 Tax=Nocardioides convexus TaxID=2712224 RepID=UPI0024187BDF|nr:zinc-binding dehydrogenase [Nocardioides convexus]
MAGIGAAINTGAITRGKSIAVIGCGGVGVAAIAGAALAGAHPIIAVDIDAKKLEKATALGATHTVDSSATDPVEEIKRICAETYDGAEGADVVVEAVGRPETWKQAFYARDLAGTVVLVGVPTPDMKVPDLPLIDVFGRGGALKSRPGTATACPAATSRCSSTCTARGSSTWTPSSPRRSAWVTWRRRSSGCTAATSCARSWSSDGRPAARGPRRHQRHLLPRRGDLRRRQQRLGAR